MANRLGTIFFSLIGLILALGLAAVIASNAVCSEQKCQNKSTKEQRQAPNNGAVKNLNATDIAEAKAYREEQREDEKAALDRRVADATDDLAKYTFWLFVSTFILAVLTGGLVAFAVRQSQDSNEAVKAPLEAPKQHKPLLDRLNGF